MTDSGVDRWTHPAVILVATDLSDLDRLMPFALDQARQTGARLILLHAIAIVHGHVSGCRWRCPTTIPRPRSSLLKRNCGPGARLPTARTSLCDGLVREGHADAADRGRSPAVSGGSNSSRDTEPQQARQDAARLCGRTSAALGQPPGHHRGTRGSSPGGKAGGEERVVLHATTLRETSRPSAALACQMAASLKAKLVLLTCCPPGTMRCGASGQPTGMDSAAMHELRLAGSRKPAQAAASRLSRWWFTAILPSRFLPRRRSARPT